MQGAQHHQRKDEYPTRRTFLVVLGGTGLALSAIPNPVRDFLIDAYKGITNPKPEDKYFEALKLGDKTFIGYQGRVFEIVPKFPKKALGIQFLVKEENPSYDRAEEEVIGKLAEQLYENPTLTGLITNKKEKIPYGSQKKISFLDPHDKYPIPRQLRDIKSLDELVK